ncbi:hypothetical protein [uncultured Rhodoferax sp.]|uniref:hypothetical protein n=1 Tax=uncultured Rhodoferax sp. TaxID=223188 RepID=UPI0025E1470E|nr:hypothetical protein [uncultured Rhodoferax sp.]
MHTIKPLTKLSREEIRLLAFAAADRGEGADESNPFDPESPSWPVFLEAHQERKSQLCEA